MAAIRVLIADDHALVRAGFRRMLDEFKDMEVVGEAEDGIAALEQIESVRPDVAMLDVTMPRLNGVETARRVAAAFPETKVLIVSLHAEEAFVVEALRAGALGYVVKSAGVDKLERALRTVARGETYLCTIVAGETLQRLMDSPGGVPGPAQLTGRQREVLQLIAEGYATKEIAHLLGLSPKTVENHRAALVNRLGARGVADLVRHAIRMGLVSPES